ncbi:MAG: lipoprotein insertase outer membrane protein LolB [Desulfobacteraceae bacterium]|nr:lipoprotein insertase outer membrane protein LolB [Desulfobacteraceae bacterium]
MTRIIRIALFSLALLTLCGCATFQTPHLIYQPGAVVETLSATASLSITKGDQGMGANGYLLYQRPDRMRLVILSPFGTTLMEAIVTGKRITIISNTKGEAFSGNLDELPREGQGETWRNASWIMEMDPPGSFVGDGTLERVNSLGNKEQVTFENGLVVSKSLANGDMVRYRDYELVNGVPLATEIIMDSHDGGRFRIKVTDPEVNGELAPDAFRPHLDGYKRYPLSALQGP